MRTVRETHGLITALEFVLIFALRVLNTMVITRLGLAFRCAQQSHLHFLITRPDYAFRFALLLQITTQITSLKDVRSTALWTLLPIQLRENVWKLVQRIGMDSIQLIDAFRHVLQASLPIIYSIFVWKNARSIQSFTATLIPTYVCLNVQHQTTPLETLSHKNALIS